MTTTERADKILEGMPDLPVYRDKMKKLIAAQIEEAVREAVDRTIESRKSLWVAEGFHAAREKAKGISQEACLEIGCSAFEAEGVVRRTRDAIAIRIGEMEPDK